MTDSAKVRPGKRERLVVAATQVLHEQGVEKTTIADIAQVADVPVGNVYYYFKTKDQLVEAAIGEHAAHMREMITRLDQYDEPQDRLKGLIRGWAEQSDLAAQFGCPFGTLASELDKRADGLDVVAAQVLQFLVDWVEQQFKAMGQTESRDLAIALVAAYQGIALITNTFRDPELMTREGLRLERWIDSLT